MELQISHSVRTKYKRKIFYVEKKLKIVTALRKLCKWKGVNIKSWVCSDTI